MHVLNILEHSGDATFFGTRKVSLVVLWFASKGFCSKFYIKELNISLFLVACFELGNILLMFVIVGTFGKPLENITIWLCNVMNVM